VTTAPSTTQVFAIDPSHTTAEFVVRHMMIAKVRGRFTALAGTIEATDGGRTPTAVRATIETGSISTSESQRDTHLRSPDFFDAETYPKIEFESTKIVANGDEFDVHGNLTIRNKTLPVVLRTTFEGTSKDPWGNERAGYEAHGKISRKEFGLLWNQTLESGGVVVGDEVKIELSVEGVAQK
jgi:polyisoprenoid-binding protein YceI